MPTILPSVLAGSSDLQGCSKKPTIADRTCLTVGLAVVVK